MSRLVLALLASLLFGVDQGNAQPPQGAVPTLAELARKPEFKRTWAQATAGTPLPPWVKRLQGPSLPFKNVPQGNVTYTLGYLCKTHECGNNFLHVLISPDQSKAWGLLVQVRPCKESITQPSKYARQTWIGKPDPELKDLLQRELEANPNWK